MSNNNYVTKIIIIVSLFTIIATIRVPTVWPTKPPLLNKYHRPPINKYGTVLQQPTTNNIRQIKKSKPYGPQLLVFKESQKKPHLYHHNHHYPQQQQQQHQRQYNNKRYKPQLLLTTTNNNDWIPMIMPPEQQKINSNSLFYQNNDIIRPPKNYISFNEADNKYFPKLPLHQSLQHQQPIIKNIKNYRDDQTHEAIISNNNFHDDKSDLSEPVIDDEEEETAPIRSDSSSSEHEKPLDIPTKPIYPGEGLWAKRSKSRHHHRPFISPHKSSKLLDDDNHEEPDGYEVFRENSQLFDKQQKSLRNLFDDDNNNKNNLKTQHLKTQEEVEDEVEGDAVEEFTPIKSYAQVRRSESEQHLSPAEAPEPRLREVVRDSKIQTVYTEEGYEDIAYDHAGHEKNAEQDEGLSEFEKDEEKKKEKKVPRNLVFDSLPAGSEYHQALKNDKMKTNNFISTKETKTTAVKDRGNGTRELEISSEVKVMMTPMNGTKAHKYIKIYPKVYRYDKINNEIDQDITTTTTTTTNTPLIEQLNAVVVEIPPPTTTVTPPKALNIQDNELEVMESVRIAISQPINKIQPLLRRPSRRRKRFTNNIPSVEVDTAFIDQINHNIPKVVTIDRTKLKYPYYEMTGLNPNSPLRYSEDMANIPRKYGNDLAFYEQADTRRECVEVENDVNPIPDRVQNAENDEEETKDVQDVVDGPRLKNLGDKIDCFKLKYFGHNPLDSPIFKEDLIGPVQNIFKPFSLSNNNLKRGDRQVNKHHQKLRQNSPEIEDHVELIYSTTKAPPLTIKKSIDDDGDDENKKKKLHPDVEIINIKEIIKAEKAAENRVPEIPVVSIITTPKYTIDLTPKNIYDQIQLLQYLPQSGAGAANQILTTTPSPSTTTIRTTPLSINRQRVTTNYPTTSPRPIIIRSSTTIEPTSTTSRAKLVSYEPKRQQRKPKIMNHPSTTSTEASETISSTAFSPIIVSSEKDDDDDNESSPPESQALVKGKRRVRPRRPQYHIFDINKFLPKNPYSQLDDYVAKATNIQKHKVRLSEVHYKDDIQPEEQLNVFADVINNIKNSSKDPLLAEATQSTGQIAVKLNTFGRIQAPLSNHMKIQSDNFGKQPIFNFKSTVRPLIASTPIPRPTGKIRHVYHRHKNNNYEELLEENMQNNDAIGNYETIELLKVNKKDTPKVATTSTTTSTTTTKSTIILANNHKMNPSLNNLGQSTRHPLNKAEIEAFNTPAAVVIGMQPPNPPLKKHIRKSHNHHSPAPSSDKESHPVVLPPIFNYYVQGMRPPSAQQKVHLYSDYKLGLANNNVLRKKNGFNHHQQRFKRANRRHNRQSYSEVARNRNRPIDEQKEEESVEESDEDDDDYMPHRPRNYHYDEKTGRIIYNENHNKKNDDDDDEMDESDEEDEEVSTEKMSAPNSKRRYSASSSTSTPNSSEDNMSEPSFIDFIMKLKSSLSYHEIPDPKAKTAATEKLVLTTTTTTTMKPVSTTPPEFLNILAKVRNDSNYKTIEDKKPSSTTKATTTTTSTTTTTTTTTAATTTKTVKSSTAAEAVVELAEQTGETQIENVQNSPGGQSNQGLSLQIFDITDYIPKIKNYYPKTSINVTRYKTIERPAVQLRHKLSSRYNADDEGALEDVNTNRVPILMQNHKDEEQNQQQQPEQEDVEEEEDKPQRVRSTTVEPVTRRTIRTTTTPSPAPTTARKHWSRTRSRIVTTTERPFTMAPIIVDQREQTSLDETIPEHHMKPVRTFPRRRPGRIKINRSNDDQFINDPDNNENVTKIVHRRHQQQQQIISNLNNNYQQDDDGQEKLNVARRMNDDQKTLQDDITTRRPHRGQPRRIQHQMPIMLNNNYDLTNNHRRRQNTNKNEMESTKVPSDVYFFKKYNKTNKHGGDNDGKDPLNGEVIETRNIQQVEVYEKFDKTKDDGSGNNYKRNDDDYEEEEEDNAKKPLNSEVIESRKVVQVFNEYDQVNKHYGDDDASGEDSSSSSEENPTSKGQAQENVQVYKKYDTTKKHGGNYQAENDGQKVVDVFKPYDQTKQHGGNYKAKQQMEAANQEQQQQQNVQVFKTYDKAKKHGGNYRRQQDDPLMVKQQDDAQQQQQVDVFKPYDKTKQHGGNYHRENGQSEDNPKEDEQKQVETVQQYDPTINHHENHKRQDDQTGNIENQPDNVEVFQPYDPTIKHGGNYRREHDNAENSETNEQKQVQVIAPQQRHRGSYRWQDKGQTSSSSVAKNDQTVVVFKPFDKTKKHGGNYRRKENDQTVVVNTPKQVEIIKQYDKTKKHGGNDKKSDDDNGVKRLTDIVPKPYSFYSDPKLPMHVNQLKEVNNKVVVELEEMSGPNEEEYDQDEVKIYIDKEEATTTKKPLNIIKDPSMRMYYYAPI